MSMLPHTRFNRRISWREIPLHTSTDDQCTAMNPTDAGAYLIGNFARNKKPKLLSAHSQQLWALAKRSIEELISGRLWAVDKNLPKQWRKMRIIYCFNVNYLAHSYMALLDIHHFSVRCSLLLIKITGMLEPVQTVTERQARPGPTISPSQDTRHSFTN